MSQLIAEFLSRFIERQEGRDTPTSDAARDAQYPADVAAEVNAFLAR